MPSGGGHIVNADQSSKLERYLYWRIGETLRARPRDLGCLLTKQAVRADHRSLKPEAHGKVMSKATYAAIADMAGVGTATVERVLNGRGGVRPMTVEKVVKAARALDWPGRLPERHRGIIRLEVILVRPESSFFARLARSFRQIARTLDPSVQVQVTFLDEAAPEEIARHVSRPPSHRSGLVIAAPGHGRVRDALQRASAEGLHIVQVVSRALPDADLVGIDNRAAGRMAGLMVSRLNPRAGRVVALCHSQIYEVHRERLAGFSAYMAAHPRQDLSFDHVIFGHDDRDLAERRLGEALRQWPDLVGIYNAGGANTGVFRALRHAGRGVFFVGHELTAQSTEALKDGTADVIFDQLPEAQARRAIDLLLWRIGLVGEAVDNPPIRFTTVTAENA